MRHRWLLVVVGVVVFLDQVSKAWALSELGGGRVVDVVWTLRFNLGFNSGFAFGNGQGFGVLVGVVACAVTAYMLRAMLFTDSRAVGIGLALVAGGACGNIVDRLFRNGGLMRGKVVDFIDLQWWPVFNVADSAITVGAVFLVVGAILEWRHERLDIVDGGSA